MVQDNKRKKTIKIRPGNAVFTAVRLVHSIPASVAKRFWMRKWEGGEGAEDEKNSAFILVNSSSNYSAGVLNRMM